ncbi:MAG: hypothetical protein U0793_24455 [Gemmataceae bacterium]
MIETRPGKLLDFESDVKVVEILKAHPFLKGKDVVTVDKQLGVHPFLIFVAVGTDRLDAYRGVEIAPKSDMLAYLRGGLKLADAPAAERLRHAFQHLQSDDFEVSLDAYRQFAKASYLDYRSLAATLPAETIAGWLASPKTAPFRYGLYASLLGHAGAKEPEKYGKALRGMIDDPEKRNSSGIDGLLAGYTMLQPKEALRYLNDRLSDSREEFLLRYACLRTLRFLWEDRPDIVPEKELAAAMMMAARAPDMSDFAIEDLRRWNRWETLPAVVDLFGKKGYDTTLIRKAILRYALHAQAQGAKEASAFVARQDPTWVRSVLQGLERETDLKKPYERDGGKAKTTKTK